MIYPEVRRIYQPGYLRYKGERHEDIRIKGELSPVACSSAITCAAGASQENLAGAAARITWADLPAVTPEREQNDTPGVVGSVVIRVPLGAAEWGFGLTSCWSPTRLLGH